MKRTPLKRHTRINPKRSTPRRRKTVVRLTGPALRQLRADCWCRDHCDCQICGMFTHYAPRYDGDPFAYDMAHIVSRGAGGSDTLDNVRTLCHRCHMAEHNGKLNSGSK